MAQFMSHLQRSLKGEIMLIVAGYRFVAHFIDWYRIVLQWGSDFTTILLF